MVGPEPDTWKSSGSEAKCRAPRESVRPALDGPNAPPAWCAGHLVNDDAFSVRISATEGAHQIERSRLDPRADDAGARAAACLRDDLQPHGSRCRGAVLSQLHRIRRAGVADRACVLHA